MTLPINPNIGPTFTPPVGNTTPPVPAQPQPAVSPPAQTEEPAPSPAEASISQNQTQTIEDASFNPLGFELIEKVKDLGSQAKEALGNVSSDLAISSAKRAAKSKKHETAAKILEKVIESDPTHAEAHYQLGNAYRNLGDNEKALELYNKSLELDPENARAMTNKGVLVNEQGHHQEAAELYTQAIEIMEANQDPYVGMAVNNLGVANRELGHTEEAAKNFATAASSGVDLAKDNLNTLLENNPDNAEVQYQMGNVHLRAGDRDKAIGFYDKSLELNPENARAMTNKGLALNDQGHHQEAANLYSQAIELMEANGDPYVGMAMNNLGIANEKLGLTEEAAKNFSKAASSGVDLAKDNLNKLLENNPDNADAHYQMGNVHQRAGEVDKAIEFYDKSLELDPENARAMTNKGVLVNDQGHPQEALNLYTQAIELMEANQDPYVDMAINNVGIAHQKMGNLEEAAQNFARAASMGSDIAMDNLNRLIEEHPENQALSQYLMSVSP